MKALIALVLVALLAAVAWVGAGPYRVTAEIREGIRDRDSARLERHVDFNELRAGLREQLKTTINARAEQDKQQNPYASLAASIAMAMVDGMVDSFVTPAGLAGLSSGRVASTAPDAPPEPFANARYVWESHDRFAVHVPTGNGNDVVFVLTRRQLDWKMTAIRLPGVANAP